MRGTREVVRHGARQQRVAELAGLGLNGCPGLGSAWEKAKEGDEEMANSVRGSGRRVGTTEVAHSGEVAQPNSGKQSQWQESERERETRLVTKLTTLQSSSISLLVKRGGGGGDQQT